MIVDLNIKQVMDQEERQHLKRVMKICGRLDLVNHMPTRNDNTLDLFANDIALFVDSEIYKTSISDHKIME